MDLSIKRELQEDQSESWFEVPCEYEKDQWSYGETPVKSEPSDEQNSDCGDGVENSVTPDSVYAQCLLKSQQNDTVYHNNGEDSNTVQVDRKFVKQGLILSDYNNETYAEEPFDPQNNKNQLECEICLKTFSRIPNLNRHRRAHLGVKLFECNICTKKFGQLHHLNRHIGIHSGEKPFECNICTKKFNQPHHLRRHKQTHDGKKNYECDICFKKLSRPSTLKDHKRSHSGERLFECNICLKNLTTLSNLNEHKRIHSGYKPHNCNICMKKFRQVSDMKKHVLSHSKKKKVKTESEESIVTIISPLPLKSTAVSEVSTNTSEGIS